MTNTKILGSLLFLGLTVSAFAAKHTDDPNIPKATAVNPNKTLAEFMAKSDLNAAKNLLKEASENLASAANIETSTPADEAKLCAILSKFNEQILDESTPHGKAPAPESLMSSLVKSYTLNELPPELNLFFNNMRHPYLIIKESCVRRSPNKQIKVIENEAVTIQRRKNIKAQLLEFQKGVDLLKKQLDELKPIENPLKKAANPK